MFDSHRMAHKQYQELNTRSASRPKHPKFASWRNGADFCPRSKPTGELSTLSSLVSIGVVGIHGQPWPELSRPVRPQRAISSGHRTACARKLYVLRAMLPWEGHQRDLLSCC